MKDLGEYLQHTRIKNGVSVTEACEDLLISTSQLENIESGNVRAFKDVYELRDFVKSYAKYLGLDPNKVVDEFNNFLFQHTSKIALDDIVALQKKKEEMEKKVHSPYTKEYKEKVQIWPFLLLILALALLVGILYLVVSQVNESPNRIDELKSIKSEVLDYEFAN